MTLMLTCALILSEVLVNEPGSAVSLEWIELQATRPTSLSDYRLVVNGNSLELAQATLDSGQYLVVVRDSIRFENHFGNSSGTWGDAPIENYDILERSFSLPNSSGEVELVSQEGTDLFSYKGTAADGISYERIGDSIWQTTSESVSHTVGHRNHGLPVPYDWGIERAYTDPPMVAPFSTVLIHVQVRNQGTQPRASRIYLSQPPGTPADSLAFTGSPGDRVELSFALTARPGLNRVRLTLADDERQANNTKDVHFYAADAPIVISEIYPAPIGIEPEWIELFVASDTVTSADAFSISDDQDTISISSGLQLLNPGSYIVLTGDRAAFLMHYGNIDAPVWELAGFPALNNTGDQLTILFETAPVDRVDYPSVGGRRGVSFERVGLTQQWGFSVDSQGSTPGLRNSIDVQYSPDIQIDATPNPFAPGLGERVIIEYTVPFNAEGELRLYGGDGRHLRTLIPHSPLVSGHYSWDGRDRAGHLLPIGIYLLQIRLLQPVEFTKLSTVVIAR